MNNDTGDLIKNRLLKKKNSVTAQPMKILHVRFGSQAGAMGGGGARLIELSKQWRGRCIFYVSTNKTTFLWQTKLGLDASPYYLITSDWTWKQNIPSLLFSVLEVIFFSPKKPVDIVYSRSHYLFDLVPAIWMKILTRAKMVVYIGSDVFPRYSGRSALVRTIVRFDHLLSMLLMKIFANLIFIFNLPDRKNLSEFGIKDSKMYTLNYGINMEKISDVPAPPTRQYDALYFGRICDAKGSRELIIAWKDVIKKNPQAKLLMFGPIDKKYREKLDRLLQELDIANSVFIKDPIYDDATKYKLIKNSKLFVLPSYVDTWCIALAEALACKTPAVVYDLPALTAIYGNAVTACSTGNIKEIANKILQLLDDAVLRDLMAKKGFELVKDYTWASACEQEFQALKSLLQEIRK